MLIASSMMPLNVDEMAQSANAKPANLVNLFSARDAMNGSALTCDSVNRPAPGIVRGMAERIRLAGVVAFSLTLAALSARAGDDVVLADFEGRDYGAWTADGD